jgi:hypothetical protein
VRPFFPPHHAKDRAPGAPVFGGMAAFRPVSSLTPIVKMLRSKPSVSEGAQAGGGSRQRRRAPPSRDPSTPRTICRPTVLPRVRAALLARVSARVSPHRPPAEPEPSEARSPYHVVGSTTLPRISCGAGWGQRTSCGFPQRGPPPWPLVCRAAGNPGSSRCLRRVGHPSFCRANYRAQQNTVAILFNAG